MTGLELIVIAANLLAAGWICFGRKDKRRDGPALFILAAAFLLHAGIGQLRLQMLPAYILGFTSRPDASRPAHSQRGWPARPSRLTIAALSLLVLALSGGSAYLA